MLGHVNAMCRMRACLIYIVLQEWQKMDAQYVAKIQQAQCKDATQTSRSDWLSVILLPQHKSWCGILAYGAVYMVFTTYSSSQKSV